MSTGGSRIRLGSPPTTPPARGANRICDPVKLYSFGPGANSLKPLPSLYKKELEFESVLLNPAKFEHHADW